MNNFKEVHINLFNELLRSFKSSRTRCTLVRTDDGWTVFDVCMVLQPFEVTAQVNTLWESDSLKFIEYFDSFKHAEFKYEEFFRTESRTIGNLDISIPHLAKAHFYSDLFNGRSWRQRYPTKSKGVSLKKAAAIDREAQQKLRERISEEVKFHPRTPYRSLDWFSTVLLGTNRDLLGETVVEVAAPFWARIGRVDVKDRILRCEYKFAPSMVERVEGWHTYHMKDGRVELHSAGWQPESRHDVEERELRYIDEHDMPYDPRDVSSIKVTINLEGKFAIDYDTKELDVPRVRLWPLLQKLDEKAGGKMMDFMRGGPGKVRCDGFELAVANLLGSLGFNTAMIGSLNKSGVDIIAIPPDEADVVLVECSRAGPKQKVANCVRTLEKMKDLFPQYRFKGAVVIADIVPKITRESIGRSDIAIFDSNDLRKLVEHAEDRPSPGIVMEVLRGIRDFVPEVRGAPRRA